MNDTLSPPRDPVMQQLLKFLDGNHDGLDWLDQNRPGLVCLLRALGGGPRAREKLQRLTPTEWDDIFELTASEELEPHLLRHHPDEHSLFAAVMGEEDAIKRLRKHKPSYLLLADIIRKAHEHSLAAARRAESDGRGNGSEAADVGCLIGEKHLVEGDYYRAIEAFSRSIETQPTADALEGRARAYRALAILDESQARELRGE
jgi:tetratricopeptide (TPR) repeat protein